MAVPEAKPAKGRVPPFRSPAEEADYWQTHSPLDYPDDWHEAEQVRPRRALEHILGVRLDARTLDRLAAIARQKGLGPSTLARMWLLERLALVERTDRPEPTERSRQAGEVPPGETPR